MLRKTTAITTLDYCISRCSFHVARTEPKEHATIVIAADIMRKQSSFDKELAAAAINVGNGFI